MPHSILRLSTSHLFRVLGGALLWGLIELVALARSRRTARSRARR